MRKKFQELSKNDTSTPINCKSCFVYDSQGMSNIWLEMVKNASYFFLL